jgi:hypothetical protein
MQALLGVDTSIEVGRPEWDRVLWISYGDALGMLSGGKEESVEEMFGMLSLRA